MKRKGSKTIWDLESIGNAIERFFLEYQRYPSALDFDMTDYLPTSRTLQRGFGGLIGIRRSLKLDTPEDYTKGKLRSEVGKRMYADSIIFEEDFYNFLVTAFPEVTVHEHKILRPGHVCCDFYIYTGKGSGVAIDIFYARDMHSLCGIVNNKQRRYAGLACQTFFILVGNPKISQNQLDALVKNKKNQSDGFRLFTEEFFKLNIHTLIFSVAS